MPNTPVLTKQVLWTKCSFQGPPPNGFDAWDEFLAHCHETGIYSGLYVMALRPGNAHEPPADARDAARYRWLRDDHAYAPEEEVVRGGEDLDKLCDAGLAENPPSPAPPLDTTMTWEELP